MTPILFYTNSDDNGYTNKSFQYLLGFQPSYGFMVLSETTLFVVLDARYYEKLSTLDASQIHERCGKHIIITPILLNQKIEDIIKEHLNTRKIQIENSVPLSFYHSLLDYGFEVKIKAPYFTKQRLTKYESEIKALKKAIQIIKKVWREIEKLNAAGLLIGKREIEIRQFIISKIFEFGGNGESFEAIVAFGKNSAIPHHEAGKTKIGNGVLLVDMGALYDGYCSDFTRTLWVGEQNDQFQDYTKIHRIVKGAHDAAEKHIKIGRDVSEIDMVARNYIKEKGYGEYFTHSTGHGVGLDIHELPHVTTKKPGTKIEPGMVFTIEPGIYLPGDFGVRYENIMIVE